MKRLRRLRFRLRALFRGARLDREMDEEMRFHLDQAAREQVETGALSPVEARRAAALAFGGRERMREETRDARGVRWIEDTVRDLRHGARALGRSRAYTTVSVLTLALAIGANTAVFSLVNGFLWKPVLPGGDSAVVHIVATNKDASRHQRTFSGDDLALLRGANDIFAAVAGHLTGPMITGPDTRQLRRGMVAFVTADYFRVCDVRPHAGRFFTTEEAEAGAPVAVISHATWTRLGGTPEIIGRTLVVEAETVTVIGVAAPGFQGVAPLLTPEFWIPLAVRFYTAGSAAGASAARPPVIHIVARLQRGVTTTRALAALAALEPRLDALSPQHPPRELSLAAPARFDMPGRPGSLTTVITAAGLLVLGLAATVLIIAGLNLANMQLARGATRRHEVAVRLALGAARHRIVRLLLCESLLLAVAGAVLGLVLSGWLGAFLGRWLATLSARIGLGMEFDFSLDGRVLAITALYGIGVTALSSIVPALKATRVDVTDDLKRQAGAAPMAGGGWGRLVTPRHALVMTQLAFSLALLVCAGLFVRFARTSVDLDPGFRMENRLVFEIDYDLTGRSPTFAVSTAFGLDPASRMHAFREQQERFARETRRHREEMLARAAALPGVRRAALASSVPYSSRETGMRRMQVFGGSDTVGVDDASATATTVRVVDGAITEDYLDLMGIPLVRGRGLTGDEVTSGRHVAVIDDYAAQVLFPGQDPLGRQIVLASGRAAPAPYEIVGLVRSPRDNPRSERPPMRIYRPFWTPEAEGERMPQTYLHLELVPGIAAPAVIDAMRRQLAAIDPEIHAQFALTLQEHVASNPAFSLLQFGASFFALIGGVALLIAAVGAYGVNAYLVAQRTREIGVRLALGARPVQVFGFVMAQSALRTAIAVGAGSVLAVLAGQGLAGVFYLVQPFDAPVLGCAAGVLAATALLACLGPAWRAASVDPIKTLRAE